MKKFLLFTLSLCACAPANPLGQLKPLQEIATGIVGAYSIRISPDGSKLLAGSSAGQGPQLYELTGFAPVVGFQNYELKNANGDTAWLKDSQGFIAPNSPMGFVRLNAQNGAAQPVYANGKLDGVTLSADGTRVASIENGRAVAVFDSNTGVRLWTIPVKGFVTEVIANPTLESFAVQITVFNASLLSFKDGRQIASVNGATGNAFSSNGATWAVSDTSGLHLYDAVTGEKKQSFVRGGRAQGVAFSPDNRLIATISNTTNRLLDAKTGDEVWSESRVKGGTIAGGTERVLGFTPDGKYLVLSKPGTDVILFYGVPGKSVFKQAKAQ